MVVVGVLRQSLETCTFRFRVEKMYVAVSEPYGPVSEAYVGSVPDTNPHFHLEPAVLGLTQFAISICIFTMVTRISTRALLAISIAALCSMAVGWRREPSSDEDLLPG